MLVTFSIYRIGHQQLEVVAKKNLHGSRLDLHPSPTSVTNIRDQHRCNQFGILMMIPLKHSCTVIVQKICVDFEILKYFFGILEKHLDYDQIIVKT